MPIKHIYSIKPAITPEGHPTFKLIDQWFIEDSPFGPAVGCKVLATNSNRQVLETAILHLTSGDSHDPK